MRLIIIIAVLFCTSCKTLDEIDKQLENEVVKVLEPKEEPAKPVVPTKPAYGLHSKAWADYYVKKCSARVKGGSKWCRAMVSPNKDSISSFRKVYGANTPFYLMPKEDKFEAGIKLLDIAVGAVANSQGKICRIANWYRPEPYNSSVGGAKRSQHIWAGAIDIKFCSRADRNKAIKYYNGVEKRIKNLGIGTYSGSNSVTVHLDFATRNYGPGI